MNVPQCLCYQNKNMSCIVKEVSEIWWNSKEHFIAVIVFQFLGFFMKTESN